MLVLSRTEGEEIVITAAGRKIVVRVASIHPTGRKVRLGFTADRDIKIHRAEVQEQEDADARSEG